MNERQRAGRTLSRRTFLGGVGASTVALAGCLGGGNDAVVDTTVGPDDDSIFRFNATEGDTITLSLDINSGEASGFTLSPIENGTPRSNPLRTEVISESDEFEITAPETREYWLSIGSGTVDVTVTVDSAE